MGGYHDGQVRSELLWACKVPVPCHACHVSWRRWFPCTCCWGSGSETGRGKQMVGMGMEPTKEDKE
eukprot:648764-Rhodomonas_salina.1